jgi:hypothetical protein
MGILDMAFEPRVFFPQDMEYVLFSSKADSFWFI